MKKKILSVIKWPLEQLYIFRINHLFLLRSEARRAFEAQRAESKAEFDEAREKFRQSVFQLMQVRMSSTSTNYELKITINRGALETKAGSNAAIADISLEIARVIVNRHNNSKAAAAKAKAKI